MYFNNPILRKSFRQRHRIKALALSLVIHLVIVMGFVLFIFNQEKIKIIKKPAETLPELPIQIVNKKESSNLKLTKANGDIPIPENRHIKREVTIAKPKQSKEIAKLSVHPTLSANKGPLSASAKFDPHFDAPDLSTGTRLKPDFDSIISPELPFVDISGLDSQKHRSKSMGSQQKRTGNGFRITRTGKTNGSGIGEWEGNKDRNGTGNNEGNITFTSIENLTNDIVASSGGNSIDVVFVLDKSNSMRDNIIFLVEQLSDVDDVFKTAKIDYMYGLTVFYAKRDSRKSVIYKKEIFQLTRNISSIKQEFSSIRNAGDENVLDAIHDTVTQMQFRTDSMKHIILITDEIKFTSKHRFTLDSVITLCEKNKVYVNVLGYDFPDHKQIAKETGGSWYKIPMNLRE